MNQINWDNFKVRCSAIQKVLSTSKSNPVLTEKQKEKLSELESKPKLTDKQQEDLAYLLVLKDNATKIVLSDSCIEYLMEAYAWEAYNKHSISKEMDIEYTQKGKMQEEDSITLLSRLDRAFYQKNTQRVSNDYLSGEPDLYIGDSIMSATKITDIKSVWDYPGFLKKMNEKISPTYDNQLKGYMDITGASEGEISYCLVNMPGTIVNDYKRRLFYKMGVVTEESPEYKLALESLINSMYFDDIPINQRVFKVKIEPFTQHQRDMLYDRIKVCREWLHTFHEKYESLNIK